MKRRILTVFLPIIIAFLIPSVSIAQGNDTCLSDEIRGACIEYGNEYGICPTILMALIETESRGQADAVGGGCMGLAQVNPKWHADRMKRLGVTDIFDVHGNILVATDYLAELRDTYGEISLVLDIYHGDSKAFDNHRDGILSDYAREILERSAEMEEE